MVSDYDNDLVVTVAALLFVTVTDPSYFSIEFLPVESYIIISEKLLVGSVLGALISELNVKSNGVPASKVPC